MDGVRLRGQGGDPALQSFLEAHVRHERWMQLRLTLVHYLAAGGSLLWLSLQLGRDVPGSLVLGLRASFCALMVVAAAVFTIERRWLRERERRQVAISSAVPLE
jgi:hypothetical protein